MKKVEDDISKKYKKLDSITHILELPGMYIGGIDEIEANLPILDNDKIIFKNIKYNPGLYKLFDELIVNAYDHQIRNPNDPMTIKVEFNKKKNEISVYNSGAIDVRMHP